jgi:hypothetical protein
MSPLQLGSQRLDLIVDGNPSPDMSAALLRWELVEQPKDAVTGELEVASTGTAASAIGSLQLGISISASLVSERVFDGQLVALEGRVSGSDTQSVVLHVRGSRPPEAPAASIPPALRVGLEVLQAHIRHELSPTGFRMSAEVIADIATGPGAVRVGSVAGLVGMGPLFDGLFQLRQVTLRYDQTRGLHVALTGQR